MVTVKRAQAVLRSAKESAKRINPATEAGRAEAGKLVLEIDQAESELDALSRQLLESQSAVQAQARDLTVERSRREELEKKVCDLERELAPWRRLKFVFVCVVVAGVVWLILRIAYRVAV